MFKCHNYEKTQDEGKYFAQYIKCHTQVYVGTCVNSRRQQSHTLATHSDISTTHLSTSLTYWLTAGAHLKTFGCAPVPAQSSEPTADKTKG